MAVSPVGPIQLPLPTLFKGTYSPTLFFTVKIPPSRDFLLLSAHSFESLLGWPGCAAVTSSNMTTNFTEVIDFFGLNCPNGGKYYICAGSWVEFMGCCTSDPCADGSGICPTKDHRPAGYNATRLAAATADIPGESTTEKLYKFPVTCYGEQGWLNRYACSNKGVSFFGCCKTDPCFTKFEKPPQCANKDLQTAVLRDNEYRYLVNAYDKTYNLSLTDPNNLPTENGNIRSRRHGTVLLGTRL